MHNSDLITPQHLTRKAVIYIRQSTPHQVVSHQASLRLQYALGERARQLGWPNEAIDIIDDDLGLTAASAAHRTGFKTLVAQVTLEQAGLIHKATRGALALTLPTGLVRTSQGTVQKIPHQEAQARLSLVFETFLQCRSASKVVEVFNTHELLLPRRDRFGDLAWKAPRVAAVLAILKHPAYAGAFTYGRTRTLRREPSQVRPAITRLPQEQWRVCIPDVYPPYVSWDTYLQIQDMLTDHHAEYDRHTTRGIPRPGKALLHGLVYCGECGHKMVVQYKGGTRYLCHYLRQQYRTPVCQYIAADPVDTRVVDAFLQALSPVELDVYAQALAKRQQQAERIAQAHAQHLERLRYEAAYCERQFRHVAPAHRHVAAE